ncbi:preprotein translocase subunit YajC [Altererythrobacter atlanticus]|uniref:Uncharacterized protein n=1 Tax=Croceibacterium atlanticum TaxID=1267766 RepID=A0A0F7KSC9_9SPHN|nr:hypothetical protein [Croceibacterium atlanticum]AKH42031.1 hypothetical protein WYH_00983 [Croceibacterium atlanticum]MBB5733401.1 preprotein translocase subunit YajC [Croceibacterium atlanticum]
MKLTSLAAAAALALTGVSAPALAQDAGMTVGATVYGPQGGEVGTVEKIEGGNVIVNTGNLTATLPENVFGEGENGPTIGWNKADLENAIKSAEAEQQAAFEAALVPGHEIYSVDGILLGTVESVGEDGMVVVALTDADPVQLPKEQMTMAGEKLTFLATQADLMAAVSAQNPG